MTQEKVLVVGCGLRPKPYAVNLDKVKLPGVDVVFDLDEIPEVLLPFQSGEFDRVECEDVLEHVSDPISVVQELGRVLKPGGTLWIRGPDYRFPEIVWADLTHKRAFSERTFDGFCPDTFDGKNYGHYHGPIKFRLIVRAKQVNKGLEWTMEKLP